MRQAKRIMITESIVFEVGKGDPIVDHINISYPLARVYEKDNAIPIKEVFLQVGSEIDWLTDD